MLFSFSLDGYFSYQDTWVYANCTRSHNFRKQVREGNIKAERPGNLKRIRDGVGGNVAADGGRGASRDQRRVYHAGNPGGVTLPPLSGGCEHQSGSLRPLQSVEASLGAVERPTAIYLGSASYTLSIQKRKSTHSPILAWEHSWWLVIFLTNAPHCSTPGFQKVRLLPTTGADTNSVALQMGEMW